MTDAGSRPRIAILLPYWTFWEGSVPGDLRADRAALLSHAVAAVDASARVVLARMPDSRDQAAAAAREAAAAGAEVVLVVQTMAVPPAFARAALDVLAGLPLVVWVVPAGPAGEEFGHGDITRGGATVGGAMLTSLLVRDGRPFGTVVDPVDGDRVGDAIGVALRAAAVAGALRSARIGRVGRPIDGYDSVDADPARLEAATGITIVPIAPAEVTERFRAVDDSRLAELTAEVRGSHRIDPGAEAGLGASLRAAVALRDLVSAHRLDAGAMNCHVPEIRLGDVVGLAPCLGLGLLTGDGIPWTCAGDVLTAVAMLTTRRLGGTAQYHELESLDEASGELVIASSGEHDPGFARGGPCTIVHNGWFPDDPGRGVCALLSAPAGPATLVAFAQIDAPAPAFRFVAARGEFTGSRWPATGTANAGFRFAHHPAGAAWAAWARSGANHHSSATHGDLAEAVAQVAAHLGAECATV